jgi:hypothetical protein
MPRRIRTIAALFVETDGVYFGLPGVEPWDEPKDARTYAGPHPVVAHPPCARWGRFWHGSPLKPFQFHRGADLGCFHTALAAVRAFGGVLEHPEFSSAWRWFNLAPPEPAGGWHRCDDYGGFATRIEQGFYGHIARKPTWLYACHTQLPTLLWGRDEQRLHPMVLKNRGYEQARRSGIISMIGGKHKTLIRNRSTPQFRDLLISIARTAKPPTLGGHHGRSSPPAPQAHQASSPAAHAQAT